jgi:hypothetical protein
VANFFDRFDATAPKEEEQPNFFDRFDEAQLPAQAEQPLAEPVATGKPASVIPQLPVTPTESTVPEDEGFFDRNYRYAKDALISGFENMRASSKGTAFAVAREYIQSFEREYGGPGVPLAPPDVKKEYEKYRAEAGEFAQDIAQFQKEAQERQLASPLRPETARLKAAMGDDLTFMESAKEAGAALISNPVGVIADLGTESFPNMAYMVATSLLARLGLKSPTAGAVAGGASSAISQFGNEYVGRLQKGESHDEAWKNAAIRSGVIGTFDAVSLKTAGKSAGKIVEALKTGKPATVAAKEFAKEMGTQAGLGAAGEAVGSLAIGEVPNPAAVIAEAAGELVTGPFEAVGTYKKVKGLAAPEDKLMADLDEAAAVEEANLAAAAAAQEDAEEGVTDFGQTDTQMGKPVTGQREPSISTLGQPGVLPTDAGAGRIEPTGLDDLSGAPQVTGRREEPVGGALTKTYTVADAIDQDTPVDVQLTMRQNKTGYVEYQNRLIDVSGMIQAGFTPERIIAQAIGEDTTGKNVKEKGPVGGALAPAVNPEDTFIIRDIAGTGNEGLVNYFRTYYGLKPESMPKAASIAMPLLQRADQLLARYSEAMLKSNQPHLDEPVGSMSRLGMAKVTMLPEYQEASRLAPGGLANRLVQKAMALDKGYKRANQSQFDGAVKEMQVALDEFEQALGTLPPPISDAEKQTLRQTFKDGVASSVPKVPKEQQVAASLNLLKKGLYSPSMLTDQLDAMVATGKVSYEELDKFEDAKAQKDLKDLQEGKITQATYDARQAKTDAYFKSRMGAPTTPTEPTAAPTEPTAPQVRSFVDLTPEQQKGYNAELKPYADKVKAAQKQFTEEQKAKGVPFTNAFATWQDMPHPSKDEFVAAAKDLDAKYGIRQYGEASTPATQEGPKFAEEEFGERQGKLKSDEEQMLRIFSGSMYGAGIQDVAVKELLQNAFDSVKEAVYKGVLKGPGKIDIILNDQDRTITVTDNGIGMTTQIVDDGFFTVGGTKKDVPPELRSGGYGIAKVAFMTSTAELSLDTVRDGVRNIVAGATPVQIRNGDFVIKTERASKDEHGTTVVVKIPETYIDRNGKENNVYFIIDPSYITPLKRSLVGPVEVNFTGIDAFGDIETQVLPIGKNFDDKKTPFLTKVNFDWGTADIYYGVERKNAEYGDDAPKHEVLSSGVYQFNGTGGYSSAFNINLNEKIPYDIVVNIKPSVPASDPSYPFTPEREKFRESHKEDIAALTSYLAQIARGTEAEGLQDVFKDIISMPKVAVGGVNKDVEGKLRKLFNKGGHKTAAKAFVAPKEINVTKGLVKDTKGVVLVDTTKKSERAIEKSFEADKAAPKMEQFMNEMTQDPRQPIFHNNTNVNFIEIGEKYGDPQAFFAELGSLFVDMKEAIADGMYAYAKLKAPNLWFTGISVDKGYGGVSILVPFKGNLINPFYTQFGEKTLSGVRERMLDTMIHELAHSDARSHGQPHNTEMIKIKLFLTDNGKYDIYRDKLLELLVKHESTFSAMKEAYDRSTTKNTAKSLEQYEKTSASRAIGSDAGISEDQPGAVSAGERPTRRSDIFSPSGADTGVPIGTRVIGESEITDVETKALQLSLKIGDVHPTIVEAISNNDLNGALRIASQKLSGFSAELAKQLLSLNLPTNISFNTGRDLVRRSIDFRTANQQKRLFDYVRRNYENLYNKYFTNYDRSENLEQVYAGLKELAKDSYKLGPVDAEYNDVLDSFNKNMDGIVAPGGYFDVFDEITLNTNTLTGKSYRVMLHEIVHAATQYVLTTDPKNLTAEQLAAREELTRMYNYAVKKVPPGQYGLTNIFEFVSEVMTNKQFQNYLKNIPYTPRKKPFFQRFVAAVMKLVGIDNLAGAAILEANRIFSATRERDPVYSGPRFAKGKRVRGPISTPQTWRTNEQVLTGMTDVVEDAIKGHPSWSAKTIMPSMWNTGTTHYRKFILGLANLRQIDDLTKTKFPQISAAVRIIEQMVASRLKKLNTAGEIINRWTKAQAKKPKQSELLGKVMLESTIRGIDPSDPKAVLNAPLQAAWNGLDQEFKDIYVDVKKYYENSVNEMVREMKRRALGLPKAERQAIIKKIDSQFGPDKLTKPYFPLRRFGKYWFQVGKGNFKEFYEFESLLDRELSMRKRQEELSRGNAQQRALAETMRKGNGISELYSQNITTTQVLRDAQELIDNVTAITVSDAKKEMQDSLNQLIYLLLPQSSMRKMFINRKAIQGASGDMLRVFATSAVHSAYQQSRFKYAEPFLNNLNEARKYVNEFSDTDRAAVYGDYIEEVEKRSKTILSNEDTSLAAQAAGKASELTFYFMLTAPFTAMLNILGFAQITMPYIGGRYGYTKANAVILKNMYRYLATSPKRTFAPLATGRVMEMQFPSIVEGGKLTGRLKDAADRFIEEGQVNISLTNDVFSLGDRPSDLYTGRYNALKRTIAALFHQSERLNREVALLSTFELAYEKYKKEPKKDFRGVIERDAQDNPVMNTEEDAFESAIRDAKDIAALSLGDFTRQMKPRFFTPPLLSVLTKFKQYPVLATYAVFRNLYLTAGAPFSKAEIKEFRNLLTNQGLSQSEVDRRVKEADAQRKELYQEGRRRLAGILGVTFLLGGVEAMPFFTLGIGTIVKMFADEDDDEFFDWENWFRNYMETELGGAAEDLFAKMGMNPEEALAWGETTAEAIGRGPASAITGGSLSERVSLDPKNLWWRDGRTGSTIREDVIQDLIANAGPVVGLGFNWLDAIDLFNEGKYQRAFEKAAPAIVSKPVAAARIEEEGPRTRSGVLQTDNFSAWELAMQAVGLQPERLAQAQKSSIEAKRYEQRVLNKRNALLDRLWLERGNSDNFNEILQEAMKFSVRHPNIAITPEVIQDSFERRTKGAAEADAIGGKFDKRMLPEVLQMMRYGK